MNMSKLVRRDIARLVLESEKYPYQSHEIPLATAEKHIGKYCKESYKQAQQGNILYRKVNSLEPALYGNPANYFRDALSGSNILNFVLDSSPYWSDFPKRSKSIFMSLQEDVAGQYGSDTNSSMYICFPYDGAKLGAGKFDVVEYNTSISEQVSMECMLYQCAFISRYLAKIFLPDEYDKISNTFESDRFQKYLEDFKYMMSAIDKACKVASVKEVIDLLSLPGASKAVGYYINEEVLSCLDAYLNNGIPVLRMLYELCTPSDVESKVIPIGELGTAMECYEIWTGSPCIFIGHDSGSEIILDNQYL